MVCIWILYVLHIYIYIIYIHGYMVLINNGKWVNDKYWDNNRILNGELGLVG